MNNESNLITEQIIPTFKIVANIEVIFLARINAEQHAPR